MSFAREVIDIDAAVVSHRIETGISLRVMRGEFVGILGPNGAGKSTLLGLINGLVRSKTGRVRVLGAEMNRTHVHHVRRRIGYVAQVERVDARMPMTVFDTVMVGCYGRLGLWKRPSQADRRRAREAMEQVGVSHLAARPIGMLSGGEYQRVAIARALAQSPEIFLFDEPTASLDPKAQFEILNLITQLHAAQHITTLYVTHHVDLDGTKAALPAACRRLVLVKRGTIVDEGAPETLLNCHTIGRLYG